MLRCIAAANKHSVQSANPHPIHNVPCQPERYFLRDRKKLALLEAHSQIDRNQLLCGSVDQNVVRVSVAQPDNIPHHRVHCDAARELEPVLEPVCGVRAHLDEYAAHHRLKVLADLLLSVLVITTSML